VFVPIHLLPLLNAKERDNYRKRWQEPETFDYQKGVAKAIRDYGNEDFLSRECGDLIESGFLEGETDLKGFQLQGQDFSLHDDWDNFKSIDFKYAEFYNSAFENATFFGASLDFSRLYKCRFVRCGFHFTSFYAATLEGVEFDQCDFAQRTVFVNCDATDTTFTKCFFQEPAFRDCQFDADTVVEQADASNRWSASSLPRNSQPAEMLRGIADAYYAGRAIDRAESAVLASARARTKYNTSGWRWILRTVIGDFLLGYGLRPLRPLFAMCAVFGIAAAVFGHAIGIGPGAMLAAGALLTFGAGTGALDALPWPYRIVYIGTAFLGVSLLTLFVSAASAYFASRR
jgi:hypothetical protein